MNVKKMCQLEAFASLGLDAY